LQKLIAWLFLGEDSLRSSRDATLAAAVTLHRAGVPLVIGSDAGSWPVNPFNFHGPTTIREMELLVRAGLSPGEAVDAATVVPAKMLGLESEIGAVEVGRSADLVILAHDPRQDILALVDVRYTVKSGVAKTPEEWLATPLLHGLAGK
jgi:imidazolonepropionase-like amidohydrolase